MRLRAALICCPAFLAGFRPARCMQVPLEPGARIRIEAPSLGDRMTGTLMAWDSDTLVVSVEGDAPGLGLIVPVSAVTRIDVSRMRGLTLEGAGGGVLAGTLLALAASPDLLDENGNCTTVECLAYAISPHLGTRLTVLGVAGALLGAIAGSETKTETWTTVPLVRLNVGAMRDAGIGLGVRIFF
jgi:hypothetical protein